MFCQTQSHPAKPGHYCRYADLLFLLGGMFLFIKSILEIKSDFFPKRQKVNLGAKINIILQIAFIDLVFSFDSLVVHGDARWATEKEIRKIGLRSRKGLLLGKDKRGFLIAVDQKILQFCSCYQILLKVLLLFLWFLRKLKSF